MQRLGRKRERERERERGDQRNAINTLAKDMSMIFGARETIEQLFTAGRLRGIVRRAFLLAV